MGKKPRTKRLYEWLGTALDKYDFPLIERDESDPIKDWIEAHPERYKGLLLVGISKCANAENFQSCVSQFLGIFLAPKPPEDLGLWWLSRAEAEQDSEKANCLFGVAIWHFFDNLSTPGLSAEFFEKWVKKGLDLQRLIDGTLTKWYRIGRRACRA